MDDKFDICCYTFYSLGMTRKKQLLIGITSAQNEEEKIIQTIQKLEVQFDITSFSTLHINHSKNQLVLGIVGLTDYSAYEVNKIFENFDTDINLYYLGYEDLTIQNDEFQIPDEKIMDDGFVVAFSEIIPFWEHPVENQSFRDLSATFEDNEPYQKIKRYIPDHKRFEKILFNSETNSPILQVVKNESFEIHDDVDGIIAESAEVELLLNKSISLPIFVRCSSHLDSFPSITHDAIDGVQLIVRDSLSNELLQFLKEIDKPILFTHALTLKRTEARFYEGEFRQVELKDKVGIMIQDLLTFARKAFEAGLRMENIWFSLGLSYEKNEEEQSLLLENKMNFSQLGFPLWVESQNDAKRFILIREYA